MTAWVMTIVPSTTAPATSGRWRRLLITRRETLTDSSSRPKCPMSEVVALWDLNEQGLQETEAELRVFAVQTSGAVVDVTDPDAVDTAMTDAVRHHGRIDIAVANAGIGGEQKPSADDSTEGWRQVFSVNLDGVSSTQRAAIRVMRGSEGGSVINMASILGRVGFPNSSAHAAAKHGVVGLTQTAAWEHAKDKIRVNAVGPGFVQTPLVERTSTPQPCISFPRSMRWDVWGARRRSRSWWRGWPVMPLRSSPVPTTPSTAAISHTDAAGFSSSAFPSTPQRPRAIRR